MPSWVPAESLRFGIVRVWRMTGQVSLRSGLRSRIAAAGEARVLERPTDETSLDHSHIR
jgi:hypothetical protein